MKKVLYFLLFVLILGVIAAGVFISSGGDISQLPETVTLENIGNIIQGQPTTSAAEDSIPRSLTGEVPTADVVFPEEPLTLKVGEEAKVKVSLTGPLSSLNGVTVNIMYDPEVIEVTRIKKLDAFATYSLTNISESLKSASTVASKYIATSPNYADFVELTIERKKEGTTSLNIFDRTTDDNISSTFTDLVGSSYGFNNASFEIN